MSTKDRIKRMNETIEKERVEEMINRVYADLPAEIRNQMIAAEFASIEARGRK